MRLSTQRITVLGSLAMVTALIVGACGGGDPTPTPGPRPTATSAPAAPTATSAPAGPTATTAPVAPTATTAPSQPRPTPTLVPIAPPTPTATPEGVQIRRGGVLNVRLLVAFEPWDTYNRRSQFSTEFTLNFWSNLMALITERPSEVEPDLVERWEVTADGKTITLHLTPGAEWHDGRPFTADDVLFNLDRAKNPSGALTAVNQGRMRRLQTFEALDDSTVRLTLDTVSASFLVSLAAPFMLMYPSHLAAEEGDIGVKNPIGTGPFKVTDYKTNQSITVVANENYHRKDELGRTLPFLDGIEFAFIRDRTLARAAFRTGEIHCGCGYDFVTPVGEELQQQVPSAKIVTFSRDAFHMFFNNIPPWNNFRVRQAIQLMFDFPTVHLLDRGGLSLYPPSTLLNLEIGGQFGLPADEILKLPGYRGVTAADREEGLRMLADAGVDPSKTTVRVNGTASFENLTVAAADQFSIMGFKSRAHGHPNWRAADGASQERRL